jgi:tetratricopeptide (TPR) repeat protein
MLGKKHFGTLWNFRTERLPSAIVKLLAVFLLCVTQHSCAIHAPTQEELNEYTRKDMNDHTKRIDDITKEMELASNSGYVGQSKLPYSSALRDNYIKAIADEYYKRGKDYKYLGDKQRATDDYNKAISLLEPLDVLYHNCYESSRITNLPKLYEVTGQLQKAIDYYTKLLDPSATDYTIGKIHYCRQSGMIENVYFDRAKIYAKAGEHQKAVDDFTETINKSPDCNWDAYYLRAKSFIDLTQYQNAIDDCSNVIDKTEASQKQYAQAYALNPSSETCGHGKWPKASPDSNYALHLQPIAAPAYYWRSVAYEKSGKRDFASHDREMAKKLGYKPDQIEP